jgi:hypothetical protein
MLKTKVIGIKLKEKDIKYYPNPLIFVELNWSRLRLVKYRENIFKNPRGIITGKPPLKNKHKNIIILKLENYL